MINGPLDDAHNQKSAKVGTSGRTPIFWESLALGYIFEIQRSLDLMISGGWVLVENVVSFSGISGSRHLRSHDLKTHDLKTQDLKTHALKTYDLKTQDLKTHDLKTHNLNTQDLKAPDLKTHDLNTHDLSTNVILTAIKCSYTRLHRTLAGFVTRKLESRIWRSRCL